MAEQQLGPPARHEYTGFDGNPQTGELRPPDNLLQWRTGYPLPDHMFEFARCGGRGQQYLCLVFGEYTASQPKP
jgi:hypothetical protein